MGTICQKVTSLSLLLEGRSHAPESVMTAMEGQATYATAFRSCRWNGRYSCRWNGRYSCRHKQPQPYARRFFRCGRQRLALTKEGTVAAKCQGVGAASTAQCRASGRSTIPLSGSHAIMMQSGRIGDSETAFDKDYKAACLTRTAYQS
jgi:hypothetical protein